jgi:hypothetical protein
MTEERASRCPDGGHCHGTTITAGSPPCEPGHCYRVRNAAPFTGTWTDHALGSCAECEELVFDGDHCTEAYEERDTLQHNRCCPWHDIPAWDGNQ